MGVNPKVCDWECAEADNCVNCIIGRFECEGCGERFCSLSLDENCLCDECRNDKEIRRLARKGLRHGSL